MQWSGRKFLEANADKSGRLMRALFSEYLCCQEDWMASSLVMTESQEDSETTGGRFSWLTKPETWLITVFFG